jgi:hypothetical protein
MVLGLEGLIDSDEAVYPALSRIADFSDDPSDVAAHKAIALLSGEWSQGPKPADQMHSEASGRHMIAVVLAGRPPRIGDQGTRAGSRSAR